MKWDFPLLDALKDAGSHLIKSFWNFTIVFGIDLDKVDSIIFGKCCSLFIADNPLIDEIVFVSN